jgi:hypothetical protein
MLRSFFLLHVDDLNLRLEFQPTRKSLRVPRGLGVSIEKFLDDSKTKPQGGGAAAASKASP